MSSKISKLKDFGIFHDYSWKPELSRTPPGSGLESVPNSLTLESYVPFIGDF
jgi:hypothetical protein